MATGRLSAIHERDPHISMTGQRIGESHAGRPGPNHQVVSIQSR
jgi:hypothetical protein